VCDALYAFLDFTGRWDERLALSLDAERRALAVSDFWNAGWRAFQGGWIHNLRRKSAEVRACADRAEAHWRNGQVGPRERSIAIRLRGIEHQLTQDYQAAILAYREVVELRRTLKSESNDVAIALNDLAGVERLSGELDAAEHEYLDALRIATAHTTSPSAKFNVDWSLALKPNLMGGRRRGGRVRW
jgi:tetratricopeptide (TPR) repeat protein